MAGIFTLSELADYLDENYTNLATGRAWTVLTSSLSSTVSNYVTATTLAPGDSASQGPHMSGAIPTPTGTFHTAPEQARSQITAVPTRSQVTVTQVTANTSQAAAATAATTNQDSSPQPQRYGGLETDREGAETRKEMLARRRKECQADDVDVALAPVLKIPVPYVFYPHQYQVFRKLFPRITPDSGLAYTHHDHPVSHTATLVGIRALQNSLRPGERVLDVFGNPNGNEAFNRFQTRRLAKRPGLPAPPIIRTLVYMNSAMDAVRKATKWGPKHDDQGLERYQVGTLTDIPSGTYDVFFFIHTLYYQTMYDICKLLSQNPNARVEALVNYSPEQSGKLYGELDFSKHDGITTQVSPNGERYSHADIDKWFQSHSFRPHTDELGCGIAWTSSQLGGPLHKITITRCPTELAKRHSYEPPSAPTLRVGVGSTFFGLVRIGSVDVQLSITNHDLASELRHFMTMRDRANPDTFADLCVKARRLTSPDLVTGSKAYAVNDGELGDHIVYAYLVDVPGETQLLDGVKLLKGDVLIPHSQALHLEGRDKTYGLFNASWARQKLFGKPEPPATLGGRSHRDDAIISNPREPRSGGLLARKRT